jgi:pilus assembly protein Flp/PilA
MNARIRKFLKEEDGITSLEYGVLAALVVGALLIAFKAGLSEVFASIITALKAAVTNATA